MKISELSKITNTSKDAIRFYIKEKIIFPKIKNTKFYFNENDIRVLNEVKYLKSLGFEIKDIKEIIFLKEMQNIDFNDIDLFKEKIIINKNKIEVKIKELANIKKNIENELTNETQFHNKAANKHSGIQIKAFLNIFKKDNVDMEIKRLILKDNFIKEGELKISKNLFLIKNDIIFLNTKIDTINHFDSNDVNLGEFFSDVLNDSNFFYYSNLIENLKDVLVNYINEKNYTMLLTNTSGAGYLLNLLKDIKYGQLIFQDDENIFLVKKVYDTLNEDNIYLNSNLFYKELDFINIDYILDSFYLDYLYNSSIEEFYLFLNFLKKTKKAIFLLKGYSLKNYVKEKENFESIIRANFVIENVESFDFDTNNENDLTYINSSFKKKIEILILKTLP